MNGNKSMMAVLGLVALAALVAGGLYLGGFFDDAASDRRNVDLGAPPPMPTPGPDRPGTVIPRDVKPLEGTSPFDPSRDASGVVADLREGETGLRINGRVLDASGASVAGARVVLIKDISQIQTQAQEDQELAELTTQDNGAFSFENINESHRYVVRASHPDHASARQTGIDPADPRTLNVVLQLGRGLAAAGRVTDLQGAPLEGVEIAVYDITVNTMEPLARPERTATSRLDGTFALDHVLPGMKKVVARKPGYAMDGRYPYEFRAGKEQEELVFTLGPGASIAGRAVDALTGVPVSGALITARPVSMLVAPPPERGEDAAMDGETKEPEGRRGAQPVLNRGVGPVAQLNPNRAFLIQVTRTDEDGRFVLDGLLNARYVLTATRKGYQHFAGSQHNAGDADVTIQISPSARVVGQVVDDQTGEPVLAFSLAATGAEDPRFFPPQGRQTFKTEDGRFEYLDVNPGKVYLMARANGYAGGRSEPLVVAAGQRIEGVVIRLLKGATLRGSVTDAAGQPVAKAKITLQGQDQGGMADNPLLAILQQHLRGASRTATTDAEGAWTLENVYEGDYTVKVEHASYSESKSDPFHCPATGSLDVPAVKLNRGGTVRGVVRAKDGGPDAQAQVMARGVDATALNSRTVNTDAQGRYEITGLKAGTYYLVVTQREGVPNPFELLIAPQKGITVTVGEGDERTVDL